MNVYNSLANQDTAIYINFPFCKLPCTYCHYIQNIEFGYAIIPNSYFNTLMHQLADVLKCLKNKHLDSVYFGGGTPSLLNDGQIEIIKQIFFDYNVTSDEFSIEIHPGMCNFDYENNTFFTRYSIGVQTVCKEIATSYHRTTYNKDVVKDMITKIRKGKSNKVINIDFVFEQFINDEEIQFVNELCPETVTFYPNTQGKGLERLRNVIKSLNYVESSLNGYKALAKSKYIFIKNNCKQSFYSKIEYEKYGNIIGIGHNSVSYIGNKSFLCLYNGCDVMLKDRTSKGERLLSSLLMGIVTGVSKKYVMQIIPNIYDKHFLLSVNEDIDISDKHICVEDNDLVYLPENEYIRFYEYLVENYSEIYQKIFLSAIGHGDNDEKTIRKVYNSEFVMNVNGKIEIKSKIKTPKLNILVEGIDGSGKDTFVRFLSNELKKRFVYSQDSRISITGQPDSSCEKGIQAKRFIEDLYIEEGQDEIEKALRINRFESEKYISTLPGIVILIRGIVTDKATFEHKFGTSAYLGEGKYIKKWDIYIVVDTEVEKADKQIEKRGIERTWREYPQHLQYFKKYYLEYQNDIFERKVVVHNDSNLEELKNKAKIMVDEIYERYK